MNREGLLTKRESAASARFLVDTDKRRSDEERCQGDKKLRCDDNYAKECGIHDLCFTWNCR
jgi:hypothetical protein